MCQQIILITHLELQQMLMLKKPEYEKLANC